MSLELFVLLPALAVAIVIVLLQRFGRRRGPRFSLRSLVLFVLAIAAAGALYHRDLSEVRVLVEKAGGTSAIAADGSKAAVYIPRSNCVRIWDTKTGTQTHSTRTASCLSLAFSPSGDLLVISEQTGVRIFNLKDQSEQVLPQSAAYFGVFSPSEEMLATGSSGNEICLWSWPDLAPIGSLDGESFSKDLKAVWSPDGTRLAVCAKEVWSKKESCRVWDVKSSRVLHTVTGSYICFSPDGQTVASVRTHWKDFGPGSRGRTGVTFMLWDANRGTLRKEWTPNESLVDDISFSREGDLLLTECSGTLSAWDPVTGQRKAYYSQKRRRVIGSGLEEVDSIVDLPNRQGLLCLGSFGTPIRAEKPCIYRWDYRARWASHPALGHVEFWLLAVLGLALLVSLGQDIRHFRKVRKQEATAGDAGQAIPPNPES